MEGATYYIYMYHTFNFEYFVFNNWRVESPWKSCWCDLRKSMHTDFAKCLDVGDRTSDSVICRMSEMTHMNRALSSTWFPVSSVKACTMEHAVNRGRTLYFS